MTSDGGKAVGLEDSKDGWPPKIQKYGGSGVLYILQESEFLRWPATSFFYLCRSNFLLFKNLFSSSKPKISIYTQPLYFSVLTLLFSIFLYQFLPSECFSDKSPIYALFPSFSYLSLFFYNKIILKVHHFGLKSLIFIKILLKIDDFRVLLCQY